MLPPLPAFEQPFELWREDGSLHLVLAPGAQLDPQHMKEFIRLVGALDPAGTCPVIMEFPAHVAVTDEARALLRRVCGAQGHAVALVATHASSRAQAEVFKHVERPAFPFRIFNDRKAAETWAHQRKAGQAARQAEVPDR
ncbi:MAG: hypothetical protein IT225_03265 [Flavobacteriales bacterium]|jgi:hypothetical protein|nr:hypothetical protein [Flavobacteriales bacterium]